MLGRAARMTWCQSRAIRAIQEAVARLPVLDKRRLDEIIGHDETGPLD